MGGVSRHVHCPMGCAPLVAVSRTRHVGCVAQESGQSTTPYDVDEYRLLRAQRASGAAQSAL
eukprot:1426743-Rhodomonas_salina.1